MKFDLAKIEKRPGLVEAWEKMEAEVGKLALIKYRTVVMRGLQQALDGMGEALNEFTVVGAGAHLADEKPSKKVPVESKTAKDDKAEFSAEILESTVAEVVKHIKTCTSKEELEALKAAEKEGKDRVSVIDAINDQVKEL